MVGKNVRFAAWMLVASVGLVACGGDSEDPAATPDAGADADAGGDTTTDTAPNPDVPPDADPLPDTTPDADTTVPDTDPDVVVPPDTTPGDVTETDTETDTPTDTGPSFNCGEGVTWAGQIFGSEAPSGGAPVYVATRAEFDYPDGGIDELLALTVANNSSVSDLSIELTDVTVFATSFTGSGAVPGYNWNFWIADANGSFTVRLNPNTVDFVPDFDIRVGHRISMTVTKVANFNGTLQIEAATDWGLTSVDNNVYVLERNATAPITAADIAENVRVTGTMTGAGTACGGSSKCWSLDYGAASGTEFRTASAFAATNDCVSFVGPLSQFSGAPQINVVNFAWVRTYTPD